jgi:hypothetical protein
LNKSDFIKVADDLQAGCSHLSQSEQKEGGGINLKVTLNFEY